MYKVNSVDFVLDDAKITFFNFLKSEAPDWNPMWHNHIYYELHFSFLRAVDYKFSDSELTLNSGEMVIIPPSVEHESITAKYSDREFLVISLDIEKLSKNEGVYEDLVSALNTNSLKPIKFPENVKEDLQTIACSEYYKTMFGMCRLKTAAAQVVYSLFKKIMPDKAFKNDKKHQKILIDLMVFSNDVTLDKIAGVTNYSKRQISRIIKEQYGITFSEIRRKIERGKQ